jgi:SAM-dependent methyltransferase
MPPALDEGPTPHDTGGYVEAFKRYRHLPEALLRRYVRDLLATVPDERRRRPIRFLDVGAGTGQFATALYDEAAAQGVRLHVSLLEPSRAFGDHLERSGLLDRAELVSERVEDYEPSDRFDLVLASEVVHLFGDDEVAFDALRDLVVDDGVVALRYGSRPQVRGRNWYEFIPAAADLDLARAPRRGEYERLLVERGFTCSSMEVDERRAISADERLGLVTAKAYSSYCVVDDEEFGVALRCLTDALKRRSVTTSWKSRMTWTKARLNMLR